MRFLNREWAEGAHDDFTLDLYQQVYVRHLRDIAADLPAGARMCALGRGTLLVGGAVIGTKRTDDRFKLVIRLVGPGGEAFLELEYEGVDFDASDVEPFEAARECLTDEFDVTAGERFEHRILIEPDGEAVIRFKDLKFKARTVSFEPRPAEEE